jgi:hypothetical protein
LLILSKEKTPEHFVEAYSINILIKQNKSNQPGGVSQEFRRLGAIPF